MATGMLIIVKVMVTKMMMRVWMMMMKMMMLMDIICNSVKMRLDE